MLNYQRVSYLDFKYLFITTYRLTLYVLQKKIKTVPPQCFSWFPPSRRARIWPRQLYRQCCHQWQKSGWRWPGPEGRWAMGLATVEPWDLILPGLLGIMITHSRETYQPTSIIMRWDRGIFNGSVSKWVTKTHELSQSNPLSNQLTPWPSYIQQPKIDAQIATLEILRWNKKSKSFIFWHPRGNKSSIRFYLISSGVLDFHHCFLFLSDFRKVEPARKHRIISKEFQEKICGFVKIWVPKNPLHCHDHHVFPPYVSFLFFFGIYPIFR